MTQTKNTPLRRLLAAHLAAVIATSAWAQVAPASSAETSPAPAAAPDKKIAVEKKPVASTTPVDEEPILLSPFEVKSDNKGYFAANTMSGTRFNTKLEDLASSMSIMTKEQMSDFGMLDINDVFLYTGNAEGTGTYTDFAVDRNGQVTDNVQLNPTGANRIRGITAANQSIGNFEVSGRMPVDPLIIDAIEVSRGPNANVFGLGNTGGTVNQVLASANLTRTKTRLELRGDSYDGWRTAFDQNVVLKKNMLAIRVSGAQQREAFQRKPSGIDARRLNAMIKFQPFKYTTISAAAIDYRMHGNRPNFTPPRDNITNWIKDGRPSWNASNSTYTLNGVTYGMVSGTVQPLTGAPTSANAITSDAFLGDFFFRPNYMFQRSNIFIDQGGVGYWTVPNSTSGATPFTSSGTFRLQLSGAGFGVTGNTSGGLNPSQPLFATLPAVSDKSIYDWSEYNLSAVNRVRESTEMYNVQLDQVLLNTQDQNLTVQVAMLTENNERYSRTPIGNSGNSGVSGQLFADVNSHNIDGTVNPYFGRTFIGVSEPRTVENPTSWKTYRGQFSYRLDLSQRQNGLKWLGTHQVSGYHEHKEKITRSYVYRDVMTSNHAWTAALAANTARANQSNITGGPQAGQALLRNFTRYYVGDANGSNVDYAPSTYEYGTYNYRFGTTGNFVSEAASIGEFATTDGTGGSANTLQVIKTDGIVMQSQLFSGQLILTGGLRQDDVYTKFGLTPQLLLNNNTSHDYATVNQWAPGDYRFNSGKTKTYGAVARPFRELSFVKKAAEGDGLSRHLGQFFRGLAFTYNKADTFLPQAPAVDLQGQLLPNTTGEGTDMGLWINLLDNKLVVRVNRYENKQLNIRNGDANTYAQRILRVDLDFANDNHQLHDVVETFTRAANPTWTQEQIEDQIAVIVQMPRAEANKLIENANAGTLAATNDFVAKGTEIEVNYNPNRYWTVAASAEEKTSKNANISSSLQQWIDRRMPVWTSIIDPRYTANANGGQWWTTPYRIDTTYAHAPYRVATTGAGTAENNYKSNVLAGYTLLKQQEGKSLPNVRQYSGRLSTSYQLGGITSHAILKNFKIGGAVRYESKGAIGYLGRADSFGIFQSLDADKPVYDKSRTYFDALISYKTKLFSDRVTANFQLNCRNIQESGRLQAIGVLPDGSPHTYRIVDPRLFILSASFDL